eukprot:2304408-Rhodomonas_salina.1
MRCPVLSHRISLPHAVPCPVVSQCMLFWYLLDGGTKLGYAAVAITYGLPLPSPRMQLGVLVLTQRAYGDQAVVAAMLLPCVRSGAATTGLLRHLLCYVLRYLLHSSCATSYVTSYATYYATSYGLLRMPGTDGRECAVPEELRGQFGPVVVSILCDVLWLR